MKQSRGEKVTLHNKFNTVGLANLKCYMTNYTDFNISRSFKRLLTGAVVEYFIKCGN